MLLLLLINAEMFIILFLELGSFYGISSYENIGFWFNHAYLSDLICLIIQIVSALIFISLYI
jgi:hypothetical protein